MCTPAAAACAIGATCGVVGASCGHSGLVEGWCGSVDVGGVMSGRCEVSIGERVARSGWRWDALVFVEEE